MPDEAMPFRAIAERAVAMIPDASAIGLGTGHAATEFLHVLAEHVRAGLRVRGVPTSEESARLARQLGIPLTTLDEVETLDLDVDGADEVDPHCNLVKGWGGALVREKIVAAASRRFVVLVGPEKLVPALGTRGVVPVEVVPFGLAFCRRRLEALGCTPRLRLHDARPFVSDNGNSILDCQVSALAQPAEFQTVVRAIPGVVEVGLFLDMADTVLIQDGTRVEECRRS